MYLSIAPLLYGHGREGGEDKCARRKREEGGAHKPGERAALVPDPTARIVEERYGFGLSWVMRCDVYVHLNCRLPG